LTGRAAYEAYEWGREGDLMRIVGSTTNRALALATLLLVAFVPLVPPVEADSGEDVVSLEEAIRADASWYAAEFDVSVAEAERRFNKREALRKLQIAISDVAGDRYAGSWLEHIPAYEAVVYVTGDTPLLGVDSLLADPAADEFAVRYGASFSWQDLRAGLDRLHPLVTDYPGASAGMDLRANTLVFRVPAPLPTTSKDAIAARAGVPVRFDAGAAVRNDHTWGGRSLAPPGCTTGFTAKTASNIKGVLSASHCPNESNRYHQNADVNYPMTVFYEFGDDDEDWEYVKEPNSQPNPHIVEPKFYSGIDYRTVTNGDAPPRPIVGDPVCHFGRTTGRSCGVIADDTSDPGDICGYPTFVSPCSAEFARVVDGPSGPDLDCDGGDSGGPWYNVFQAYGIHKASNPEWAEPSVPEECWFTITYYVDAHGFDILEG
jgi:hypothetical protein